MLPVIRAAQMAALQRDLDIRWYDGELVQQYPPFAAESNVRRYQWISGSMERASAFKLGRPEIFQFLCFEQTFFPASVEDASLDWARDILNQQSESAADRVKRLRQGAVRRLAAAQQALDDQAALELATQQENAAG